jgi:tetratricopeptide (TPR) repeat protein/tRNA A-37 threonylcarbamoyl transferase component Bud32
MSERDLFIEALRRRDPGARAAYLDQVCAGDAALRRRIEVLLELHAASDESLEVPLSTETETETEASSAEPGPELPTAGPMPGSSPDAPIAGTKLLTTPEPYDHAAPIDSSSSHAPAADRSGFIVAGLSAFDLLTELGRGGMGVVYQARHRQLNRIVALKMIVEGKHASPEHHRRFLIEAEAVARLRHPNIVQIYDIGEADGCPFVTLEMLEGGSLADQLKRSTQPGRAAAELVAALATAMHAAHQAGIVHRDLKPSNILFDSAGIPRIVDFGLAKRLDVEDKEGHTRSGQIMGTPSYMAPEQAEGLVHQIGPAADIHALGAVLYEMLTGRPPFKGVSTLETLYHVVHDDAVPPSRVQPGIARDLETICLKCLQKEPPRRYATAWELADDLQRYLGSHPIRARRTPLLERGLKWVRRHPTAAALTGLGAAAVLALVVAYRVSEANSRAAERNREIQIAGQRARHEQDLERAQSLLVAQNWPGGQLALTRLLTELKDQPRFDDLRGRAQRMLATAEKGLHEAAERAEDRERYERFVQLRNQAFFHETQFTGLDLATDLQATRTAARAALAEVAGAVPVAAPGNRPGIASGPGDTSGVPGVEAGLGPAKPPDASRGRATGGSPFGLRPQAPASGNREGLPSPFPLAQPGEDDRWTFGPPPRTLTRSEQAEIRDGCYELLLVLADGVAQPLAGEDPVVQAGRALSILDQAARLRPEPTRTYHQVRAECLARTGDPAGAERERAAAGRLQPATVLDHFLAGLVGYKRQEWKTALQEFDIVVRLEPGHFWALCLGAIASLQTNQPGLAKLSLSACILREPKFAWLYLLRGFASGQAAVQARAAGKTLGITDGSIEAGVEVQFEAAEADYARALELLGENKTSNDELRWVVRVNRGLMRFQRGRLDESVADLQEAIRLDGRKYHAHASLAQVLQRQKKWDGAVEQFTRAIALRSDSAPLYRGRAKVQSEREDATPAHRTAALRDLEEAIRYETSGNPVGALDHIDRAELLRRDRRFEEALAACDAALKIAPGLDTAHRLRVMVLLDLDRPDEVIQSCDAALAKGKPWPELYEIRGMARASRGDYLGAIDDYSHALLLRPGQPRVLASRGLAYVLSDSPRPALRDFDEALRRDASSGEAHSGRGLALVLLGDHRGAVAEAEESLRQEPLTAPRAYNAARIYAQAAMAAAAEVAEKGPVAVALVDRYQDRAVALVKLALERTSPERRTAFWQSQVAADPALRSLQRRLRPLQPAAASNNPVTSHTPSP